ncbi:MAG: M48 family metallopeptidase [Bacteroidota bacterium]
MPSKSAFGGLQFNARYFIITLNKVRCELPEKYEKASQAINQDVSGKVTGMPSSQKKYNALKLTVGLVGSLINIAYLVAVTLSGVAKSLEQWVHQLTANPYIAFLLYIFVIGSGNAILTFPLSFYSSYILEHRFELSHQTFGSWVREGMKSLSIGLVLAVPLALAVFAMLRILSWWWWLGTATLLFVVSILLARIAPILIFPIFYKFTPLEDADLKSRIERLCAEQGVNVSGIYVFNYSKDTRKANAAFAGLGRTKRILLADTLLNGFTYDEIEAVFAHELGHYVQNHIWKGIAIQTAMTFAGLAVVAVMYSYSLSWIGASSFDTLSALPLLMLWLSVYGLVITPIGNIISRAFERSADRYALLSSSSSARRTDAFISAMRRLAELNLADEAPNAVVEFLLYSHPSISRRISFAESLSKS